MTVRRRGLRGRSLGAGLGWSPEEEDPRVILVTREEWKRQGAG